MICLPCVVRFSPPRFTCAKALVPMGARSLRGKQVGNADAVAQIKANAAQHAADLRGIVDDIRRSGITTVRGIREELQSRGIRAPRGGTWHPIAVARLLKRLRNTTHAN